MSSWSLVVATMQVNVSIGSCAIIGENSYDWATSRVVGALSVESQCSWAAVPVFVMALTMSSRSFVAGKDACQGQYWIVRYSLGEYCDGWVTFTW